MASDSVKIGKIWGINVNLHWTFILLMLFFLLLSTKLFLVFLLLFVCVFVHELAHARTALKNKVPVSEIVLTPLGGATSIDQTNVDPRVEFNISIVGPITSFFIGGILGIFAALTPPGIITYTLQLLFELNIALGVLNILPAFPLDGGRVFRSYLERRYDYFKATVMTVKLSKYIAVAFVILPLIYFYFQAESIDYKILEFFIYAFVGAFLYGASSAEMQNAIIKKDAKGLTVAKALSKGFIVVSPKIELKRLYKLVEKKGVYTVLTKTEKGFMLLDLFRRRLNTGSHASDIAMPIPQLNPKTSVIDALQKLESSGIGVAVVIRNSRPIGIVSTQNLNALLSLHLMERKSSEGEIA